MFLHPIGRAYLSTCLRGDCEAIHVNPARDHPQLGCWDPSCKKCSLNANGNCHDPVYTSYIEKARHEPFFYRIIHSASDNPFHPKAAKPRAQSMCTSGMKMDKI